MLVVVSDVITFKNPNEPLQGHLVLTHDISEMMYVRSVRLNSMSFDIRTVGSNPNLPHS